MSTAPAEVSPPRPGAPIGREDAVERLAVACLAGSGAVLTGGHGSGRTTVLAAALSAVRAAGSAVAVLGADATGPDVRRALAEVDVPAPGERAGPSSVVVVDEIDRLDATGGAVLHQALSTGAAALLATALVESPTADPGPVWWRDLVPRVALEPLDRDAADALAEELIGGPIAAASREQLWAFARGHPGWLVTAVRATLGSGVWERRAGLWTLAGALDGAIDPAGLAAVGILPADVRSVLEALALATSLPIAAAEALGGSSALAAAERRGLVRVEGDEPTGLWCAPRSEMLGSAFRNGLTEEAARLAWARVEAALDVDGGGGAPVVLVRGRAVLGRVGAGGSAVDGTLDDADRQALVEGAEAAIVLSRWDQGIELAGRAWRGARDRRALDLLTQCLSVIGDHDAVRRLAADLQGEGPGADGSPVAAEIVAVSQFHTGDPEGALVTIEAARAAAGEHERALLDLMESRLRTFLGQHDLVAALLEPLVDHDDPEVRVEALTGLATCAINSGRGRDAIAGYEEAFALALGAPGPVTLAGTPFLFRLAALAEGGALEQAVTEAESVERDLAALDDPTAHGWLSLHLARVALRRGRPATAVRWAGEAVGELQRVHRPGWTAHAAALLVAAHCLAGDLDDAVEARAVWEAIPSHPVAVFRAEELRFVAALDAALGDQAAAEARLAAAVAAGHAAGVVPYLAAALHDLVRLGSPPARADATREMVGLGERSDSALVAAWVRQATALVADDLAALVAVATVLEEMGALVDAAETWAEVARRTDDDRVRADAARRGAAVRDLGERFTSPLLGGADDRPTLTDREAEIVEMLVGGRSRQEIAAVLVVSVRTIDSHLQRVYRKMGVRGRDGLIAALGPAGH